MTAGGGDVDAVVIATTKCKPSVCPKDSNLHNGWAKPTICMVFYSVAAKLVIVMTYNNVCC